MKYLLSILLTASYCTLIAQKPDIDQLLMLSKKTTDQLPEIIATSGSEVESGEANLMIYAFETDTLTIREMEQSNEVIYKTNDSDTYNTFEKTLTEKGFKMVHTTMHYYSNERAVSMTYRDKTSIVLVKVTLDSRFFPSGRHVYHIEKIIKEGSNTFLFTIRPI